VQTVRQPADDVIRGAPAGANRKYSEKVGKAVADVDRCRQLPENPGEIRSVSLWINGERIVR
jgi:hypothetical protein